MMVEKLLVYIAQMPETATTVTEYVEGYDKAEFLKDKRTQQAVVMNILIIGELTTKIAQNHINFAETNAGVPWSSMRNMRNRIAHGYYDIDFEVVWNTVSLSLPPLIKALNAIKRREYEAPRFPLL
jgi:uncharacterized protein with HEPN domain